MTTSRSEPPAPGSAPAGPGASLCCGEGRTHHLACACREAEFAALRERLAEADRAVRSSEWYGHGASLRMNAIRRFCEEEIREGGGLGRALAERVLAECDSSTDARLSALLAAESSLAAADAVLREIGKWACNTWSGRLQRIDCGRCPPCLARAHLAQRDGEPVMPTPCERCARIDAFAGERCEASGCRPDPCGPVEYHDVEGVPLCAECWQECCDEAAEERAASPDPLGVECPVGFCSSGVRETCYDEVHLPCPPHPERAAKAKEKK